MEFREFLKARRTELGLSQGQIADELSLRGQEATTARVSHWETGRNRPPIESKKFREALAAVLQMDMNEMMVQLGFVVLESQRSEQAILAANIIDSLPPIARDAALDQLRALEKHFVLRRPAQTE